eukprot:1633814-Pleurochrysis_carterae.AAC.7
MSSCTDWPWPVTRPWRRQGRCELDGQRGGGARMPNGGGHKANAITGTLRVHALCAGRSMRPARSTPHAHARGAGGEERRDACRHTAGGLAAALGIARRTGALNEGRCDAHRSEGEGRATARRLFCIHCCSAARRIRRLVKETGEAKKPKLDRVARIRATAGGARERYGAGVTARRC